MKNYLAMIRLQKRPVKFLVAQALKHTGLCNLFSIPQRGYTLRFYPSNLSRTLWIDPHDRDEDQDLLRNYIKPGDVVVDVGANIGFTALAAALATGPSGKVIAFEPHPRIFGYLGGNIARNNVGNIQAFNVALGDKSGVVSFSDSKRDDMNKPLPAGGQVQTPLRTLDECLAAEPRIDLLKVDVEGYERFVFQGGASVLSRTACVYFESSEDNFRAFNYSTRDLISLLRASGFRILRLNDQPALVDVPEDYRFIDGPMEVENFIAVRSTEDFIRRTGLRMG